MSEQSMSGEYNADRARSRLERMTVRQLEHVAEDVGFEFDKGRRRTLGKRQMVVQLMSCEAVVRRFGCGT